MNATKYLFQFKYNMSVKTKDIVTIDGALDGAYT